MKIWIEDRIGFLSGYSLCRQPGQIELETELDVKGFDFENWRYDGEKLVHDPENAHKVIVQITESELFASAILEISDELESLKERMNAK